MPNSHYDRSADVSLNREESWAWEESSMEMQTDQRAFSMWPLTYRAHHTHGRNKVKPDALRCFLSLAVFSLVSCEQEFDVLFTNNLAEQVTVSIGKQTRTVLPGAATKEHYPSIDGGENSELLVATTRCKIVYNIPQDLDSYPWRSMLKGALPVQLERDLNLYAVPPDSSGIVPISTLVPVQRSPFPLHPNRQSCE